MYIETIPNRKSPPAILLREGKRQGKKIVKTTLLNLTHWPPEYVETMRRMFAGEKLVAFKDVFAPIRSLPHGHVEAVLAVMRRLGIESLLAAEPSRLRSLAAAMIAWQILHPDSKLSAARDWKDSTLPRALGVEGADVDELYEALDWLLERQPRIEEKLARRHLAEGGLVLYDVSSSYYEGETCPLARFGYSRDGKRGLPIIVYGLMTDSEGRPVAAEVFPGGTGDASTVPAQVEKLRARFGLRRAVLVGDRGMLTQTRIKELREFQQLGWISALRCERVRSLAKAGAFQMSLFDKQNLAEIQSPDFPGERLMVCFNPLQAARRRASREALLAATEADLERIAAEAARRTQTPLSDAEIGLKAGGVLKKHKMRKHFRLTIADGAFAFERDPASIEREAALDGVYIVRTSEPKEAMSAEDAVRNYKRLAEVETAFRTLKSMDVLIRPIFHRLENRVRAHIFLCTLAYYVEWHMRRALAPLLFADEEREENRPRREPVAPAPPSPPSASARRKKATRKTADGQELHTFGSLLDHLATRVVNIYTTPSAPGAPPVEQITQPTPLQAQALQLLQTGVPMF